jgi:predicted nucleic acid-binding protein
MVSGRRQSDLVTDAEVFQEVTHLGARDAIHAAVMANHDIDRILSFGSAFDLIPGVTRLS